MWKKSIWTMFRHWNYIFILVTYKQLNNFSTIIALELMPVYALCGEAWKNCYDALSSCWKIESIACHTSVSILNYEIDSDRSSYRQTRHSSTKRNLSTGNNYDLFGGWVSIRRESSSLKHEIESIVYIYFL